MANPRIGQQTSSASVRPRGPQQPRAIIVKPSLMATMVLGLSAHDATAGLPTVDDPRLSVETVVSSGLSAPTVMAFIGHDDFLICEKNTGRVKRVINGVVQPPDEGVLDLPVNPASERGLLGIALHPNFAANGFVYLYYSFAVSDGDAWVENRVSRFTWNGTTLGSELLIVSFPFDANQANGANHDGGIILFGPDGKLYGVTGDLNRSRLEQNLSATLVAGVGGIFRLNDDGSTPTDNPFINHADPTIQRLIAYGVRNSYGMGIDTFTGNLWMTENGPDVYDEINLAFPGWSSGWVQLMGPDERDPQSVNDLVMIPGATYSDPEFSYLTPIGITSIAFIDSPALPCDLQGKAVVGDSNNGFLYLFSLNVARDGFDLSAFPNLQDLVADSAAERDQVRWGDGWGAVTDLEFGADGALYVVSLTAEDVYRIVFSNPPPPCPADIAPSRCGNGTVDVDDLLGVITAWGPCADPNDCPADIAPPSGGGGGDSQVNVDDLLAIINAWGPCP